MTFRQWALLTLGLGVVAVMGEPPRDGVDLVVRAAMFLAATGGGYALGRWEAQTRERTRADLERLRREREEALALIAARQRESLESARATTGGNSAFLEFARHVDAMNAQPAPVPEAEADAEVARKLSLQKPPA